MSVHYKFKSSLDFDTITFDGLHISVNDFRKAVVQQKRLGKTNEFELQITNAQTKEEYENDNDLIPKNTSLIISRIPQTSKKSRESQNISTPNVCPVPKFDSNTLDLSQMNASEEDKIQAMMAQSTADYDPRGYQKLRGPGQTGEVPPTYRCYKCHQTGHWIKHCPLPHSSSKKNEIKRNTGIPKSFLQEKGVKKQLSTDEIVLVEQQTEVPDELLCSICKDIFRDAVMIPCCGSSFCDDCVRTALLESDENECPDCKEKGTSPGSLIPNRFLRSAVNTFKNETGYERTGKIIGKQEVVIDSAAITTVIRSEKPNTANADNAYDVRKSLDDEPVKPTCSPKSENQLTPTDKDCKIISTEDSKASLHENVQSTSPEKQIEIVPETYKFPQNICIYKSKLTPTDKDCKIISTEDSKASLHENVQSTSPEKQIEIVPETYKFPQNICIYKSKLTPTDKDCKIISTEDSKASLHENVQSTSPEKQIEIGTPKQDVIQNLDTATESQETFKHTSPSKFSNYVHSIPELSQRSSTIDSYPLRPDSYVRHTKHNLVIPPPHVAYCNNYGNRTERYFYPRDTYNVNNAPFSYLPNTRCRQMVPHSGIQPYYQGISAPLDGIIEDPLEAFNRIMKEKEKRKEMKRLVSERQRAATVKRNHRDMSPIGEKRSRRRISPINERRNRSPFRQEKSSNHRNIERDKNIRGHRPIFTNNKRSFSRSNSPPQRRYSKSKSPRRRSRSRSHIRSHSRDMDLMRIDKPKHNNLQSHRIDYEKDAMQHDRRHPRRFSETKIAPEAGPKENRRHNSKVKENGCQSFYNFEEQNSRKTFIDTDDFQEKRDLYIGYDDRSRACEGGPKMERMCRDHESKKHHVPLEEPSKQEAEKKNKERRRKKEKDEKLEKKSKRDKKDKRKRERCKEDQKKHTEHKRTRKETERSSNANITNNGDSKIQPRLSRKDITKSPKDSSLEDRNETFTPDIDATRNQEPDDTIEISEKQLVDDNIIRSIENSDISMKDERRHQDIDTTCFGLNTPTSVFDATPENYAGKWDNFDFSIPNSEGVRGEDNRDCEHDVRLFQNSFDSQRNDLNEDSRTSKRNRDSYSRSQQQVGNFENENISRSKRPNALKMASSPNPSEGMSSSSKNSNADKSSSLKKRRKKSKHKKDKQYCKRSSSADSSKNLRKVASKHKKIRSERKKKSRRNESR